MLDRHRHDGRVKLGGETWSASPSDPEPLEPGEEVRVVRIDGATAIVARVPTIGASDAP